MLEQDNENLIRFFSIANTSYEYIRTTPVSVRNARVVEFWDNLQEEGLE